MFKLLTTMRYTPNGEMQESVYLWHRHLQRLHQGIDALSTRSASELDEDAVKKEIERAVGTADGVDKAHRVCHLPPPAIWLTRFRRFLSHSI